MFYAALDSGVDTDAIAERLKHEFEDQTAMLPPVMAELIRALAATRT